MVSLWFRPPWSEKFHMVRVNPTNRILMPRLPGFSLFDSGRPSSVRGYFIFVGPLSGYGSLFLPVDMYAHSSDMLRLSVCPLTLAFALHTRQLYSPHAPNTRSKTFHTHAQTDISEIYLLYIHTNISFLTFHTDANHSFFKTFHTLQVGATTRRNVPGNGLT